MSNNYLKLFGQTMKVVEEIVSVDKEPEQDKYVQRLMRIRCSHGSKDNYINIGKDHGVLAGADQQPLMNANDHEADTHIIHFGNCDSDENPERQFRKLLVGGVLGGAVGGGLGAVLLGDVISDTLEDIGIMSFKCTPKTDEVWIDTNDKNILDGAPALLMKSCLTCRYGGTITLVPESEYPQDDNSQENQEKDEDSDADQQTDIVRSETDAVLAAAMERIASTGEAGEQNVVEAQMMMAVATALPAAEAEHICNDPEGYFTDDFAVTWTKALECGPEQIGENYEHNNSIPFEGDYLDSNGMIINQAEMENFHINNFTVAQTGCAAIAAYNANKLLDTESTPSFADVVYEMEPYGILNNAYGMMPGGIADYFIKRGYDVDYAVTNIEQKAADADVSVIFYATPDYAHYVTCQKTDDGRFIFYNQTYGEENDVKTYKEFEAEIKQDNAFATLAITISDKE